MHIFECTLCMRRSKLNQKDDLDPWAQSTETSHNTKNDIKVETIEFIEPLSDQFGSEEPLTLPEPLLAPLFHSPTPTNAENNIAVEAPIFTYAILDASKVQGLSEMLENSGLPHCCLFKGEAFDNLKDVAPWIVQLKHGKDFTRNLFTKSDAPWHLWDAEPGIYVRSRQNLDEMQRHFRKFTRIKDERGQWHLLRYWETRSAFQYIGNGTDLRRSLLTGCTSIIVLHSGKARIAYSNQPDYERSAPVTTDLSPETRRELMLLWSAGSIADRLMSSLPSLVSAYRINQTNMEAFCYLVLLWCKKYNLRSLEDGMRLAIIHAFLGLHFDQDNSLPNDLSTDTLRLFCESNSSEELARFIRNTHANLLKLADRRKTILAWVDQGQTKIDYHAINLYLYGASYEQNPLVSDIVFKSGVLPNQIRAELLRQIEILEGL